MNQKIALRSEVNLQHTWNLTDLYKDESSFQAALAAVQRQCQQFYNKYRSNLTNSQTIVAALAEYASLSIEMFQLNSYAFLAMAVDAGDATSQQRMATISQKMSELSSKLSFVDNEIAANDEQVIEAAIKADRQYALYLKELLQAKPYLLSEDVERTLKALGSVFASPYQTYQMAKSADLDYAPIDVAGKNYPMSFVRFENNYEDSADTDLRRTAYKAFYDGLKRYNNTMAATYSGQLIKEKTLADLRGYPSIFDYLLFDQKVDQSLYHRQIDLIMDKLSQPMRRYAKLVKATNKLDKMSYADLKAPIDGAYEPTISIEESKNYMVKALSVYGTEYTDMLERAYDERWIDFVQNKGKQSGAFCASPYGVHPYILISWSESMTEVFVLAHELGHAGHFYLSQQHQNIFNTRPSLYFIEAPSTMNELLMANHLASSKADDLRFKRWILSSIIRRTYYHNFVTHLLEAHFQREVYKIVDAGGNVQSEDLNRLKLQTLRTFWGDQVEIGEEAGMTWMRQLHYYRGLYPYTYSAGLTIATAVNKRIQQNDARAIEDWKQVLKAGGSKTPVELAAMAGVDITSDQPLIETIDYIADMIEEIIAISEQLDGITVD